MKYYNSYSAIKPQKKHEKTSPTAKSKRNIPSIKTKFLSITMIAAFEQQQLERGSNDLICVEKNMTG